MRFQNWRLVLAAGVLVAGLLTSSVTAQSAETGGNSTTSSSGPRLICISPWAAMVSCTPDDAGYATGYQVEVFKRVANSLSWQQGRDYEFSCMDWTPMVDDVMADNGTCYMSAAGMDVTPEYINRGVQFSWPTYKQGLRILVVAQVQEPDSWRVFSVFHWTIWLAIGGSGVCVALFLWVTETYGARLAGYKDLPPERAAEIVLSRAASNRTSLSSIKRRAHNHWAALAYRDFEETMFRSLATLLGFAQPEPVTLAGRIVALAYGLMILLMVSLFTANTAAVVTTTRLSTMIRSIRDLPGKRVGTWTPYIPVLQKYGVLASGLPWENTEDEAAMLVALRSRKIDALVLDASFVLYQDSVNCDLHAVGETFNTWDLSFAFPPTLPMEEVDKFTRVIVDEQRANNMLDDLAGQFLTFTGSCGNSGADDSLQLRFLQVAGLWIILAGAMALALIILFMQCYCHGRRKRMLRDSLDGRSTGRSSDNISALHMAYQHNKAAMLAASERDSWDEDTASRPSVPSTYLAAPPSTLQPAGSVTPGSFAASPGQHYVVMEGREGVLNLGPVASGTHQAPIVLGAAGQQRQQAAAAAVARSGAELSGVDDGLPTVSVLTSDEPHVPGAGSSYDSCSSSGTDERR